MQETTPPPTAQLETLLRLGAGCYWRQDADFRFTSMNSHAPSSAVARAFGVGKTRWELPHLMPNAFWDAHHSVLDAHKPFYELEYSVPGPEGGAEDAQWIMASGEPVFDEQGQCSGYHGYTQDITPRKRARLALLAGERRFDDFVTALSDWLWETDANLCYSWVSPGASLVLGGDSTRYMGKRLNHVHYGSGTDHDAARLVDETIAQHLPFRDFAFRIETQGRELWIAKSGTPYTNSKGEFAGYRGTNKDITLGVQARKQLQQREQRYLALVEQSPIGMIEWNMGLRITEWNAAAQRIFGLSRAEVIGQRGNRLTAPEQQAAQRQALISAMGGELLDKQLFNNLHQAGHALLCAWTNAPLKDADGRVVGLVSMVEDLTEQSQTAERMEHLATHDTLTGLPNRATLLRQLEPVLEQTRAQSESCAVVIVNLDRFRQINDSLGHAVGDLLLQQAAQRLILTLGESTLVARLGSDEFAVLLAGSAATGDLPTVTRAAQQALSKPYAFESGQRDLTASLGVAVFPWDGDNAATLLQSAEAAMRHAKAQGRNSLQFFTPELRHAVQERKTMDQDLRRALQNNELLLHFQPQVDALTGTMTGAEALVRWMHPTRGMIRPTQFIQIAEENGLIERIGFWVLNEACRVLRDWLDHGLNGITMSVNLSALQLKNKTLAQDVAAVLAQHRLPGNNLELELTESVAMADPTATIDMLQRLRGLDVQLAIDDFGTGYSSLSYLQLLPLQRLKLDRSFVTAMDRNPKDAAICSATIALAHKLGLAVVAEGVETQVQRAYLLRDGCDVLQGYLFSQPVTADAAMAFAQAHA